MPLNAEEVIAKLRADYEASTQGRWTHDEPYLHAIRAVDLQGMELATVHLVSGFSQPAGRSAVYADGDHIAGLHNAAAALLDLARAVLEGPVHDSYNGAPGHWTCSVCHVNYPCPTASALAALCKAVS